MTATTAPATVRRVKKAVRAPTGPSTPKPSVPAPLILGQQATDFVTEAGSPFPDGYSIAGEREVLAKLLESDEADESDPLYPRLLLLEERMEQHKRMQSNFGSRLGAESVVESHEIASMRQLGGLVDEQADSMVIHTKEAYRLFMGRGKDPSKQLAPIIGGKHVASALKACWALTGTDNPFADWALVRWESNLAALQARIEQEIKNGQEALDAMKRRGLSYSVLVSKEPKSLALGFKSPYGYAVAELVVAYDYFVRVVKTQHNKALLNDEAARSLIRDVTRCIRRDFSELARFERNLLRPEVHGFNRTDYLPTADAEATSRRNFLTAVFGPIPPEVFSAKVAPKFSRRRMQLTPQDRKLLQDVSDGLAEQEREAASNDPSAVPAGLV